MEFTMKKTPTEVLTDVANDLRKRGLTYANAAEILGYKNKQTVANILSGKKYLVPAQARRFSERFQYDETFLLSGEGSLRPALDRIRSLLAELPASARIGSDSEIFSLMQDQEMPDDLLDQAIAHTLPSGVPGNISFSYVPSEMRHAQVMMWFRRIVRSLQNDSVKAIYDAIVDYDVAERSLSMEEDCPSDPQLRARCLNRRQLALAEKVENLLFEFEEEKK